MEDQLDSPSITKTLLCSKGDRVNGQGTAVEAGQVENSDSVTEPSGTAKSLYLRKTLAASTLNADKLIIFALIDAVAGKPGHLGTLDDLPSRVRGKLGGEPGHLAALYFQGPAPKGNRRLSPRIERAISEFAKRGWLKATRHAGKRSTYRLTPPGGDENDVIEISREILTKYLAGEISAANCLVLCTLYSFNTVKGGCYPSHATLAKKTGYPKVSSSAFTNGSKLRNMHTLCSICIDVT